MGGTRSRRVRVVVVGVVTVLALVASAALADTASMDDPNEATGAALDVKRIAHGHTSDGRLFHKITTYQNFNDDRAGTLDMWIFTNEGGEYVVSKYGVHDQSTGYPSGSVAMRRPSPNSVKLIFRRNSIGNPTSYRWHVRAGCGEPYCYDEDVAPNSGKLRHPDL